MNDSAFALNTHSHHHAIYASRTCAKMRKTNAGDSAPVNKVLKSRATRRDGDVGRRARTPARRRRLRYDCLLLFLISIRETCERALSRPREINAAVKNLRLATRGKKRKEKQGLCNKRSGNLIIIRKRKIALYLEVYLISFK